MNYDIIGDIHGEYDRLVALLKKMGYTNNRGSWRKPGHQALFVGDLVDGGPRQLDTIALVKNMVEHEEAYCLMGNHEFNAVAWATPDPEEPGSFLRPHTKQNRDQHIKFIEAVTQKAVYDDLIGWFKTLPLWLELDGIRAVHACWDPSSMKELAGDPDFLQGNRLGSSLWIRSSRKTDLAFKAVETLCKGPERKLPGGMEFVDRLGHRRSEVRLRWWENEFASFKEAALAPTHIVERIPETGPLRLETVPYEGIPVFFGHYGLDLRPRLLGANIGCVDFSEKSAQYLTAYQWGGEAKLTESNLIYV